MKKMTQSDKQKGRVLARVSAAELKLATGGRRKRPRPTETIPDSSGMDWTTTTVDACGDTD